MNQSIDYRKGANYGKNAKGFFWRSFACNKTLFLGADRSQCDIGSSALGTSDPAGLRPGGYGADLQSFHGLSGVCLPGGDSAPDQL